MELLRWLRLQWDRALGVAAMVVGIGLVIIGWIQVSSTEFVAEQIPYVVSAGLGGLVALLLGGTLWLSADLRDEWRALNRIDEHLTGDDERVAELEARLLDLEARLGEATNGSAPRTGRGRISVGGRTRSAG